MIKIFDMFAGYGGASFALKKAGIEHEVVGYSEIDKYAIQCYEQNHKGKNYGDCTKINPNELPDFDLLTGGFPCQSFSVAGKGLGEQDTRGTLFYEIIRIAEVKKPRYMLLENVKGLTNKNHKPTFEKILSELARIGYKVHWKILNTKDYGVPQNRERVWFVCFREKSDYDKFKFPEKEELKIFIKDVLEQNVDDKYYLSPLLQERFAKYLEDKDKILRGRPKIPYEHGKRELEYKEYTDVCPTLSQNCAAGDQMNIVAMRSFPRTGTKEEDGERHQNFEPREDGCSNSLTSVQKDNLVCLGYSRDKYGNTINLHEKVTSNTIKSCQRINQQNLIYDRKGFDSRTKGFRESELSPTLSQKMGTGGNNVPMVIGKHQKDILQPLNGSSSTITSTMYKQPPQILQLCGDRDNPSLSVKEDISNTINANSMSDRQQVVGINNSSPRECGQLRRLTPKECFRLMGFLDDKINLEGLSDTQKYKLAGNGWDINLVSKLFKQMFNFGGLN